MLGSELVLDPLADIDTGTECAVTTKELRQALGEIPSGEVVEFTAEGGFRVTKDVEDSGTPRRRTNDPEIKP